MFFHDEGGASRLMSSRPSWLGEQVQSHLATSYPRNVGMTRSRKERGSSSPSPTFKHWTAYSEPSGQKRFAWNGGDWHSKQHAATRQEKTVQTNIPKKHSIHKRHPPRALPSRCTKCQTGAVPHTTSWGRAMISEPGLQ